MGTLRVSEEASQATETLPEVPGDSRVPRSIYCDCPRIHEAFPRVRGLTQMPWGPNKTNIFLMICRTLAVTRSWILVSYEQEFIDIQ